MVGFEVGWLIWIGRLTGSAAICNVMVSCLTYVWPQASSGVWHAVVITGIVVTLAAINIIGASESAILSDILTVGKLIPLVLFVAVGLFFINPNSYSFVTPPAPPLSRWWSCS